MNIQATAIPEVKLILPTRHGDARGFFAETYKHSAFAAVGIDVAWVQDNHSLSATRGVLRGLHYQLPPVPQAKLIRVIRGSILDVAVDIRPGSPTFGQHVRAVLSAENFLQMFIPVGFAHGFVTLEDHTEVLYKVNAPWAPALERGIAWNDARLAIEWGFGPAEVTLSDRDRRLPPFADIEPWAQAQPPAEKRP